MPGFVYNTLNTMESPIHKSQNALPQINRTFTEKKNKLPKINCYIYMYICVCVCVCIYICICVCVYICVYICVCVCVYIYIYICVYICVCVYMCVCVYIYIYMCVYVYIYTYVYICVYIQWGKKVFSQPPIVQVLPLKKMREACNSHHRYTSTMRDKIRKTIQKITL